jgi:cyclophilin family peptidyl-prolyl cis-trans isomerase
MRTPLLLLAAMLLLGLPSAQATNSVVRFTYYHGSVTVGSMDIELFNEAKPVTVSNFLSYVRNGAYDNLMLHRVVTGFVMQAGFLWSQNPKSLTPPFNTTYYVPSLGPITNEFNVGPRYSNVVGTIAMARAIPSFPEADLTFEERVAGTNSASTDWFINLADNSAKLDTNWGGFTVFGQVVAGTELLEFFSSPGPSLSTINLYGFNDVPVAYAANPTRYPRYADLYHVRIEEFPSNDQIRPTVSITYPPAGARLTNRSGTITGTASDNVGIRYIWYALNNNPLSAAPAGREWSVQADFKPGTNWFYVQSVDTSGLRSIGNPYPFTVRSWFVSQWEPLSLTINGPGTVTGGTNGQRFEVDRPVTLKAIPAPGHVFAGWNGNRLYEQNMIRFLMPTGAQISVAFVTNPFPRVKGSYSGLFYNTNYSIQNGPYPIQPSGAVDLAITDQGKVSGKLRVAGRSLPFSGNISAHGLARVRVTATAVQALFPPSYPNWYLDFDLDLNGNPDLVQGGYVTDNETFASALVLHRVHPGSATNPSPYLGTYTVAINPGTNGSQPQGLGFATAKVNAAGIATLTGSLADGTPFTHTAPVIATNGFHAFYATPYGDKGWLYGWLQFQPGQPAGDVQGPLVWRKKGPQAGKPYPAGFEFYPRLMGSRYTAPGITNRILDFAEGIVTFAGPNLANEITNQVSVGLNNSITNLSPNKLSLLIAKPAGTFSGNVQPPGETRLVPFKGALLPALGYGVGYYLSTNLSGRVHFGP